MTARSARLTAPLALATWALAAVLGACGTIPQGGTSPTPGSSTDATSTKGPAAEPSPPPTSIGESTPAAPTPSAATTRSGAVDKSEQPSRQAEAVIRQVPTAQWAAMRKAGMVRPECPVTKRSQLRRVDVPYVDFDGDTQRGHLIVRVDTAASVARIFTRLYEMKFPIRRMEGVENYGGDVYKSLNADNTSAYNCRRAAQINAPFAKSPHANGRAVDINPVENPWKDPRCRCWSPTGEHARRSTGPGKIVKDDRVWRLFDDEGWIWQNISVADYMHFDTGYPSRGYRRP